MAGANLHFLEPSTNKILDFTVVKLASHGTALTMAHHPLREKQIGFDLLIRRAGLQLQLELLRPLEVIQI